MSVVAAMMPREERRMASLQRKASGYMGVSKPLRLVVDRRIHGEELRRFDANVVRGPGVDDCANGTGAVGADGYGRF